jgi:NAD(P)H-dependent FMN reductase
MFSKAWRTVILLIIIFCTASCSWKVVPISQPEPGVPNKTLILYYTRTGTNEIVAKAVNDLIKDATVEQVKSDVGVPASAFWYKFPFTKAKIEPIEANPEEFNNIILCTPVYLQGISPPIKTVIKDFPLEEKNVSVLATCGGMYFSMFHPLVRGSLKRRGAIVNGVYVVKVGGKSEEEIALQVKEHLGKIGFDILNNKPVNQ